MKQNRRSMLTVLVVCTTACANCFLSLPAIAQSGTRIRLTDISKECGINFIHTDGGTGQRYVVESVVGGLASLDFDCDGFTDVFFVNGMSLESNGPGRNRGNALYRNNGDFTFTNVTEQAGVGKPSYGMGAVSADYDQDGDPDLYVSNFGQNLFYVNNGDGSFTESTESIGLVLPDRVGLAAAFLDIENDGDLDLFVGSYVQFTLDKHIQRMIGKYQFHPGPTDYPPSPDAVFRNDGDGTFTNISESSGISSQSSYSMGVVAFDAEQDGDADIMIANDQRANTLWINDGHGHFVDQAMMAGVAFDRLGHANGNMGVEIGDVNADGLQDIFITTYQDEMPVLYLNLGSGLFIDQTNVLRIDNRLRPHVTWGCGLVDFDNDADLDIYVACGHFMDNIQFIDDRTSVKVRDFVLENRSGKYADVSSQVGSGLAVVESSRGTVFEDFDNDGDIDVVVLNANAAPSVLRNDTDAKTFGTRLAVIGTRSNRGAVGATLKVERAQRSQVIQVVAGRGYQSHYGSFPHLGIGDDPPKIVVVQWPNGIKEAFAWVESKATQYLIEGFGKVIETGHDLP